MSSISNMNKTLHNKNFLYAMIILSIVNMLGYVSVNKSNALIIFIIVGLITSRFNKNKASILLITLVITNFLMAFNSVKEGLEVQSKDVESKDDESKDVEPKDDVETNDDDDKLDSVDSQLSKGVVSLKNKSNSINSIKESMTSSKPGTVPKSGTATSDANDTDTIYNDEGFEPIASNAEKIHSKNNQTKNEKGRIDYASTLEEAYDNLDNMLGSDGINNLTNNTEKLMIKQKKLFDTMKNMTPMLQEAKNMLKGFNLNGINGLGDISAILGKQ